MGTKSTEHSKHGKRGAKAIAEKIRNGQLPTDYYKRIAKKRWRKVRAAQRAAQAE